MGSLAGQEPARALALGLEPEIERLRQHDGKKRAFELLFFPAMFLSGLSLLAYSSQSLNGGAALAMAILGTCVAAAGLNSMVLLLHEGLHGVLLPHPVWNRVVAFLLGVPILMSFSAYRVLHTRHHRYLGDPRDPDDYHNYTSSTWLIWCLHYTRLALGSFLYLLFIPILALRYGEPRERIGILVEYTLLAAIWSALIILLSAPVLVSVWLAPALLTGFLVNLRGFCQHGLADASDPFLASRSVLPRPFLAFLLLNENLHLEHHLFPDVPSYRLPALRRLLVERYPRQTTTRSYSEVLIQFVRQSWRRDESPIGQVSNLQNRGGVRETA